MNKVFIFICFLIFYGNQVFAQQVELSNLTGKYLGQKEPGMKAEIFAQGLVSIGEGVHGNIVFTTDFSEAAWHPNYKVNGKSIIYIIRSENGKWGEPVEFTPPDGNNCSEPFYSFDMKKFYFLSGMNAQSGNAENEKIWFVERNGEGWSKPQLLSSEVPAFHWQFSFDTNNNLYFGGGSNDRKGEIFISQFKNGEYLTPERLPETVNSQASEFSPFISPDNSYLVFTRLIEKEKAPPEMNLFVSFRNSSGNWTEAKNLTEKISLSVQTPFIMMSAARVTPDGKYLFFCYFNGSGHMVYWISTKIIEELRTGK